MSNKIKNVQGRASDHRSCAGMRNVLRLLQDRSAWTLGQLLADALMCFAAILLAQYQVLGASGPRTAPLIDGVMPVVGFALLMPLLFSLTGTYRRPSPELNLLSMVGRALLALLLGICIALLALPATSGFDQATAVIGRAGLYLMIGITAVRCVVCLLEASSFAAYRVLIVGTGPEALRVADELRADVRKHAVVVGFYPTSARAAVPSPMLPVFSSTMTVDGVVDLYGVDEVLVAVEDRRACGVPMDQLLACRIRGIPVLDLAGFYERVSGEVPTESLRASWLVYENGFAQGPIRRLVKRTFDIVSSLLLLALFAPVMLLTAIAIRLEGPGPLIYRQERVGLHGRSFTCLKFRSMRIDAEKDGVARWATDNDARITHVGAFIRKARFDELPQLFSVLRGEMSIVGPRPERPSFVQELKRLIPYYDLRHSVKPGITGWAQVRYHYGGTLEGARRKHQYDLYYVKNNCLLLDLLVLVETVSVVLFGEGAK